MQRVLVVEDDERIAAPLLRALQREGYAAEHLAEGGPAIERVRAGDVDLVLLDLGLPDLDGIDVCRTIRGDGFAGGVVILTARDGELDRVVGLDSGADDYLPKPFTLAELLARARAVLRRAAPREQAPPAAGATGDTPAGTARDPGPGAPATPPAAGPGQGLVVDRGARRVWVRDEELALTPKEFDVLALLGTEPGTVLTRERLISDIWDENWFGSTKTLDTTMGRLRQKLEDLGAPVRIVTVRGIGFRLEDADGA
jgi:DNA-binding response OmpR family regulator